MARVRKPQPTWETLFFATPEQKVLRFLLSEPTTAYSPRVISSRLKGVRGLGGVDGIVKILNQLEVLGMVEWLDNRREVRLKDDCACIQRIKAFSAVCDLEGLKKLLQPVSSKGILYGVRAKGTASTDSHYDLYVVSDSPEEVKKITSRYPIGKMIGLHAATPDEDLTIERQNPKLAQNVSQGIIMWGSTW